MLKFRRSFDYVVPVLIGGYIVWGWYLTLFEVGWGYLDARQGNLDSVFYMCDMFIWLSIASYLYFFLVFQPHHHSVPPSDVSGPAKSTAFECVDEHGNLATCRKGKCNGRIKPPRTHHCSTCGVCREGFDHHCPWIGTCVTIRNRRSFLGFLVATLVTIYTGLRPMMSPVWRHTLAAYEASKVDSWILSHWWNCRYSWVLFGGPPGRFVGAALLGFGALKRKHNQEQSKHVLGSLVSEPSMVTLLTILASLLFGVFCLCIFIVTFRNIILGVTTMDGQIRERFRRTHGREPFIWLPIPGAQSVTPADDGLKTVQGQAWPMLLEERPYDQGWKENVRVYLNSGKESPDDFRLNVALNPRMLERMSRLAQQPEFSFPSIEDSGI